MTHGGGMTWLPPTYDPDLNLLLDRTNGKSIQTVPYVDFMNWSLGVNDKGQPTNNPAKDATVDGTLVSPGSATNWPPPSFSPKTGLLYVGTSQGYGLQYLTDHRRATRSGMRGSMRRRRTHQSRFCSTDGNSSSSAPAIRCTRSLWRDSLDAIGSRRSRENLFYLLQVIHVVPCEHAHDVLD